MEKEGEGEKKYVDLQNRYGWTALMQAACYGHSGSVVLLLQRGANVHLTNDWGVSALVLASQGGHFGVVHTLINHGAKVCESWCVNPWYVILVCQSWYVNPGMSILVCDPGMSILVCDPGMSILVCDPGMSILVCDPGMSILVCDPGMSILVCDPGMSILVCDPGMSILVCDPGMSILVCECQYTIIMGALHIVLRGYLLYIGRKTRSNQDMLYCCFQVNPEYKEEISGSLTPLMAAAQCGHVEIIRELLRSGAELELKLKSTKWTALMLATLNNQV